MDTALFVVVFVVVVLLIVSVLVVSYKVYGKKRKTVRASARSEDVDLDDPTEFVARLGGQFEFERLGFIFPSTRVEVVREYNRAMVEFEQKRAVFEKEVERLSAVWREKNLLIPEDDGTPETELLRRDAQDVSSRAFEALKKERRFWDAFYRNKPDAETFVRKAREMELARIMEFGTIVVEETDNGDSSKSVRRIYRLPDNRYFLLRFCVGFMNDLKVSNIVHFTDAQGQFSRKELKAIVADKGRLAAAQCGVFEG